MKILQRLLPTAILLLSSRHAHGFVARPASSVSPRTVQRATGAPGFRPDGPVKRRWAARPQPSDEAADLVGVPLETESPVLTAVSALAPLAVASVPVALALPLPAEAAAAGPVPSALLAYGHYVALLLAVGLLAFERSLIEADMTAEQERSAAIADGLYVAALLGVVASGAARTSDYGKGADFYLHEPLFWLKLALVGVQLGIAAFPALTHARRFGGVFGNEKFVPLSDKLATRLQKVLNAEISGLLAIPLAATLMARGVGYSADFPWPAGAALAGLGLLGSSFFYAKQSLTWTEDERAGTSEDA